MVRFLLFFISIIPCGLFGQSIGEFSFGGVNADCGQSIISSQDGGFLLFGTTRSKGSGSSDLGLIKLNDHGGIEKELTFGGVHQDWGTWITNVPAGGYALLGSSWDFGAGRTDLYLVRLNERLEVLWEKNYGGLHYEYGACVKALCGGGFLLSGFTKSFSGAGDIYLVRTDSEGNLIWERNFDIDQQDYGFEVEQTEDGGFLVLGISNGFHDISLHSYYNSNSDIILLKLDSSGNLIWQKPYGGQFHDFISQIEPGPNGGYFLIGSTQSEGSGSFDLRLSKIDDQGTEHWVKTFGGAEFEYGESISVSKEHIYLTGTTKSFGTGGSPDLYLIKTDLQGNPFWELTFGNEGSDAGHSVLATADGGCVVTGMTISQETGKSNYYFLHLDGDGNFINVSGGNQVQASFYPNPMDNFANVEVYTGGICKDFELGIFDPSGKLIRKEIIEGSTGQILRNGLQAGAYFYVIWLGGKRTFGGKFIVR